MHAYATHAHADTHRHAYTYIHREERKDWNLTSTVALTEEVSFQSFFKRRESVTVSDVTSGGGGFFLACKDFGRRVENLIPACA